MSYAALAGLFLLAPLLALVLAAMQIGRAHV